MVPPSLPPRACPFGSSFPLTQLMCLVGCIKDPPNSVFLTTFLNGTRSLLPLPSLSTPPSPGFTSPGSWLPVCLDRSSVCLDRSLSCHLSLSDPTSVCQQILLAPPLRCSGLTHTHLLTISTAATFIQGSLTACLLASDHRPLWLVSYSSQSPR